MSSAHNDLATWAGKARARGQKTIEITVELADEVSETIVRQASRITDLEHLIRSTTPQRKARDA